MIEQLFTRYGEIAEQVLNDGEQEISQMLYIDGFKYADLEKLKKIHNLVQKKIDKKVRLVQDVLIVLIKFGMLKKDVDAQDHSLVRQLQKDIEMQINSLMFELDKLESLRARSSHIIRTAEQKPQSQSMTSLKQPSTEGTMALSSYQFYKAQKDTAIQSHSQKWIQKQYQIAQKKIDDEVKFIKFQQEIQDKQTKAELNLNEYQQWQRSQLMQQEQKNEERLQTHKQRVIQLGTMRQQIIEEKMNAKDHQAEKQKSLLHDYQQVLQTQKRAHFERIKQKADQVNLSKTLGSFKQQELAQQKEQQIAKKQKYIEEMREWNQNYLRQQSQQKQGRIERANQIVQAQMEQRRKNFEDKEEKHNNYKNHYDKVYSQYQESIIEEKNKKMQKFLFQKAFQDASQEEFTKFQYNLRAKSEQQGQRLKEKRMKLTQDEIAGELLIKKIEISKKMEQINEEVENKRLQLLQHEEDLLRRSKIIESDEAKLRREREIQSRKLEIEKEEKLRQIKHLK